MIRTSLRLMISLSAALWLLCAPSSQAASPEVTQQIALSPGWNSVALTLGPVAGSTMRDLYDLGQTQGVTLGLAAHYNGRNWSVFRPGLPLGDFPLRAGQPLLLYAEQAGVLTVQGESLFACGE